MQENNEKENISSSSVSFFKTPESQLFSPKTSPRYTRSKVVTTPILIDCEIVSNRLFITLSTASRIDTNGDTIGQGDHVTAYRTFLDLISAGIYNQQPLNIINSLVNIASCYLTTEKMKVLKEYVADYKDEMNQHGMKWEERKEFTNILRNVSLNNEKHEMAFNEENVQKIKNIIIYANNAILSKYIKKISMYLLEKTNQMEFMTFSKKRKYEKSQVIEKSNETEENNLDNEKEEKNDNDNNKKRKLKSKNENKIKKKKLNNLHEGMDVQSAIKALMSLERLLLIYGENDTKNKQELLKSYVDKHGSKNKKEDYFINGLSYYYENNTKLLGTLIDIEITEKKFIKDTVRTLSKSMLTEENALNNINKLVKNLLDNDLTEEIGGLIEQLYDYPKVQNDKENSLNILFKTSARHIVIIFQSYQNITASLKINQKKAIIENFIKNVLNKQGWSDFKYLTKEVEFLTLDNKYYFDNLIQYLSEDYTKLVMEEKNLLSVGKKITFEEISDQEQQTGIGNSISVSESSKNLSDH